MSLHRFTLLLSTALCAAAVPSFAQTAGPSVNADAESATSSLNGIDTITVTGMARRSGIDAAAVTFLDAEDLALQGYSDINRVLRAVPGVNLQEEDGYGLRPNIGLRGSGADRSSKVLIMEDGVLMAPAPYSAPAAYYFPVTGRMSAVEVSKGAATVQYGPNTTAGAIQLFSTPIPEKASAHLSIMVSDLDRKTAHGWAGTRFDAGSFDIGVLAETYQDRTDGFKDLDTGDTGFELSDYVLKLGGYSHDGRQSLELKYQYKDETSDETYLGLSQADFSVNPNRRYNASALDQMVNDHTTLQATHNIDIGDKFHLTTVAYKTEFARNWRKLDRFDNSQISGNAACSGLDSILRSPAICTGEIAVLQGAAGFVSPDNVLQIRANNRAYESTGIQSALSAALDFGNITHNLSLSVRYHEDHVSRFQDQDGYRIDNTRLVLTDDQAPGTQANRFSDAKALSTYVQDSFDVGKLSITAGVRVEDVQSMQIRWSTPDRGLAPSSVRENSYTEVLPALAARYKLTDSISLLGGVHKGFSAAPVSSRMSTNPERSIVYEGGLRYRGAQGLHVDAVAFFNDYSNLLGECTGSSGSFNCDPGDAFNAGEVDVSGLELTAAYDLSDNIGGDISYPVSLTYSYTQTDIQTTFADSFWGNVSAGDELPYVPENQLSLTAGAHAERWGINAAYNYSGETRNVAGAGAPPSDEVIGSRSLIDLSGYYDIKDGVRLKLKAENLFDETYIAARRPYGLRPGKPREIFAGIALDF